MAQISTTVRGNEIEWEATFASVDYPLLEAGSATLRVNYPIANAARASYSAAMVKGGDGKWRASWNSGNAVAPGEVMWSVQSAGAIIAAAEGRFDLKANLSNRSAL